MDMTARDISDVTRHGTIWKCLQHVTGILCDDDSRHGTGMTVSLAYILIINIVTLSHNI